MYCIIQGIPNVMGCQTIARLEVVGDQGDTDAGALILEAVHAL